MKIDELLEAVDSNAVASKLISLNKEFSDVLKMFAARVNAVGYEEACRVSLSKLTMLEPMIEFLAVGHHVTKKLLERNQHLRQQIINKVNSGL